MQVKLSAVVITYNEERNIARCLDSIKEIADEVIVVDSYSTDNTVNICLERGATVLKHKFEGHVEQKNWACTQAQFQYILSLDADEALNDELKNAVLNAKNNWQFDGYYMNRLTNYCGKWIRHCGWYPDKKLRLWDRTKGKWGGTNPHDKFEMNETAKIGKLDGDILHYSFYTIEQHRKQIHYFTDISSKALFKKGKRSNLLKQLVHPFAKFVKGYIIHMGFLDGKYGFIICRLSGYANYLKYTKLRKLSKELKNP